MPYSPTTWVDGVTKLGPTNLNKIETELARLKTGADLDPAAAIAQSQLALNGYTAYTPTWTSNGTQPSLGNGTITGRYSQVGKYVSVWIVLTMGSTTTFGTGTYIFSLPVAANAGIGTNFPFGKGAVDHAGSLYPGEIVGGGGGVIGVVPAQPVTALWGQTVPITFTSGDVIRMQFSYEAA